MVRSNHNPITVAILGGDPMVGRTLELMLERAGYYARFLNGSFIEQPAAMPEEVGLVILSPGLEDDRRLLPSIDSIIMETAVGTWISRVKTFLGEAGSPGDDIAFAPMAGAAWASQQAYGR